MNREIDPLAREEALQAAFRTIERSYGKGA